MRAPLRAYEIQRVRLELAELARHRGSPGADLETQRARAGRALEEARALGSRELVTYAVRLIAGMDAESGRWGDVVRILAEHEPQMGYLREQRSGLESASLYVSALAALARGEADEERARDRWREIVGRGEEGARIAEELRRGVTPPEQLSAFASSFIGIYAALIEARLALGDDAGALAAAERVKCRSATRLASGRREEAPHEEALRALTRQLDEAQREGRQAPEALLERRRTLANLVFIHRFAENAELAARFDANELRARLPPELAVVSWFWLDRERLLVAALHRGALVTAIETFTAEERAAIDDKARSILELRGVPSWRGAVELDEAPFDRLLPHAVRAACEGKTRLVLSPHRSLHGLPLHLLPWTDGRWLMRSFAISYAPNLTLLMRPLPPVDRARPVLFVGVPRRTLSPPLPLGGVEREELRVRKLHDPSRFSSLTPPRGTKDELLELSRSGELGRYGVLHFACHGLNGHPDSPMESRLMLHDADLDGLDVSSLRTEADLVVLSACHSGQRPVFGRGLDELPGDDLFGLQAAFFAAGAKQLLGALWPVRDGIAPLITERVHGELARVPADIALQRALFALLDDDPNLQRLPPAWASFFLTAVGLPAASDGAIAAAAEAAPPAAPLFQVELAIEEAADRGAIEARLRERLDGLEAIGASTILGQARASDPTGAGALGVAVAVSEGREPVGALRELVDALRALSAELEGVRDATIHAGERACALGELDEAVFSELARASRD